MKTYTNPQDGHQTPNVVDTWKVTVGKMMAALSPYRDYPEVREEMDFLEIHDRSAQVDSVGNYGTRIELSEAA